MSSRCRHLAVTLLCPPRILAGARILADARVLAGATILTGAGILACAGQSQTTSPGRAPGAAPPRLTELREDFDPEPYRDDGLVIQPEFGWPVTSRSLQTPPAPAPAPFEPAPELGAAADDAAYGEMPPALAAPNSATVYRVQVMALSSEEAARALADGLQQRLSAPVSVWPEGELFMVRVGEATSPTVAEALRGRIVALGREYADAYVITEQVAVVGARGGDADALPAPSLDLPPADEAPVPVVVELVRTSGWRVLLHQTQSYEEATDFRRKALRRLQRNGIDLAVDIVFAAPWYKVEGGNFRTATEAQQLVERVKGLGYRNALKVRDEVYLPRGED